MDPIGYWMGKPISEMSRERLLVLVRDLALLQQQAEARHDRHMKELESLLDSPRRARGPFGLW